MTNEITASTMGAAPEFFAPVISCQFRSGDVLLFALQLTGLVIFLTVLVVAVCKKRTGADTEALSRISLLTAVIILFFGTGIIICVLANRLAELCVITPDTWYIGVLKFVEILYSLANNIVLSGIGFVLAIVLKGKRQ